jgi:hypothetical protein
VGGAPLCEALLSLRDVTARDLRADGQEVLDKLSSEVARLDATLEQNLREVRRG